MKWFWIGFEDLSSPRGQRAKGCIVLCAVDERAARRAAALDFPRLEAHVAEVPEKLGAPPSVLDAHRRLTNEEAADLAVRWGLGGIASAEDIRESMSDDAAKPGEPLFKRSK